jgi:hypothetical protein
MSISFWCPDAPLIKIACPAIEDCKLTGIYCRKDCDGTREESEAPECHFSNDNAYDILDLLGMPVDPHGEVEKGKLYIVQQHLLRAINIPHERKHLIRQPKLIYRFFDGGNEDEDTLERLYKLRGLVSYAQAHDFKLVWG